jgi:HlyD family secretion protein
MTTVVQTLLARLKQAALPRWVPAPVRDWVRRNPRPAAALALALTVALLFTLARGCGGGARKELTYHTVTRGDFVVSIVEGGSLRAVNEQVIRCEVEGTTRIISIVPEGTVVKKGELLVELDSSELQERLSQQEITYENYKFATLQAQEQLAIQKSLAESNQREAELRVVFAESDLEKYEKADYPSEKDVIESKIVLTKEDLGRSQERLRWTRELFNRKYASKNELDTDEAKVKSVEIDLRQWERKLEVLEKYDFPKRKALLQSNVDQAKDDLTRLKQRTASQLAQAEADLESRQRTLEVHNLRMESLKEQLKFTKIFAPQDGLVVYPGSSSFRNDTLIEEGVSVRQRQELIKLPDTSTMLVDVKVHETFVNQVTPGLLAYVTIDSLPESRFIASVRRVAPLPDAASRYYNPNLKVYSTEVVIEEPLPDIKPGVSAHVEIVITNLQDVISIPLQAVTTHKGGQVVYVAGRSTPVPVEIGYNNDRFVQIKSGLEAGQRVLLSPPLGDSGQPAAGSAVSSDEIEAAKSKLGQQNGEPAKGAVSRREGSPSSSKPPPAPKPAKESSGAGKPDKPAKDSSGSNKPPKPPKPVLFPSSNNSGR